MAGTCFMRVNGNGIKVYVRVEGNVSVDTVDLIDISDVEQKYITSFWEEKSYFDESADGFLNGFFFIGSKELSTSGFITLREAGFERKRALPYSIKLSPDVDFVKDFNYIDHTPIQQGDWYGGRMLECTNPPGFMQLGNPSMW